MCEQCFIASDHPLPILPFEWPPNNIWVDHLQDYNEGVRALFTKPYVYYIGSNMGCGCGFRYGGVETEEDRLRYPEQLRPRINEFEANGRKSVKQLSDYLSAAVESGPVEFYVHWLDEPFGPPRYHMTVTPDHFGGRKFSLKGRTLYIVQRSIPSTEPGRKIAADV